MGDNVRELLAQAQAAEVRGDRAKAVSLLNKAADIYEQGDNLARAEKMRRHVARLETEAQTALPSVKSDSVAALEPDWRAEGRFIHERGPTPPDQSLDAWCSFCCRPHKESGPLVGGPTGSFICKECVDTAHRLIPQAERSAPLSLAPALRAAQVSLVTLAEQNDVRARIETRAAKAAMLLGPEGCGKSALLHAWGPVWPLGSVAPLGDHAGIDLARAATAEEEAAVLRWLEASPARRLIIATRGALPDPVLTLKNSGGEQRIYGSDSVWLAIGRKLSAGFVAKVEAFFAIAPLGQASLSALGTRWLQERADVSVDAQALLKMVELANASGRGAHELRALISRVPQGIWQS
ncbi:MAG: ClpX C4-type zinc finger protein [Myxococcaceae bacterium]|nr:ClpX C4-type zinc finger protein [Myxococcaceae bacterium]